MRTVAALLLLASAFAGCGSDELECSPPSGSLPTDGTFELTYVDEIAPHSSMSMRPRVLRGEAEAVELWACEKRGSQMWILEATVTLSADATVPAEFARTSGEASVRAVMTRYDKYRVIEEQVADMSGGTVTGTLRDFDAEAGALAFDAVLSEDYVDLERLPAVRSLTLDADLSW